METLALLLYSCGCKHTHPSPGTCSAGTRRRLRTPEPSAARSLSGHASVGGGIVELERRVEVRHEARWNSCRSRTRWSSRGSALRAGLAGGRASGAALDRARPRARACRATGRRQCHGATLRGSRARSVGRARPDLTSAGCAVWAAHEFAHLRDASSPAPGWRRAASERRRRMSLHGFIGQTLDTLEVGGCSSERGDSCLADDRLNDPVVVYAELAGSLPAAMRSAQLLSLWISPAELRKNRALSAARSVSSPCAGSTSSTGRSAADGGVPRHRRASRARDSRSRRPDRRRGSENESPVMIALIDGSQRTTPMSCGLRTRDAERPCSGTEKLSLAFTGATSKVLTLDAAHAIGLDAELHDRVLGGVRGRRMHGEAKPTRHRARGRVLSGRRRSRRQCSLRVRRAGPARGSRRPARSHTTSRALDRCSSSFQLGSTTAESETRHAARRTTQSVTALVRSIRS